MNNFTIKYFHQELIKLINNCGLSVGTAYFVIKDVMHDLEKMYNEYAYKESQSDNVDKEAHTMEVSQFELDKEEKENEGTNTDASEYSGSVNDN